MNHFMCCNKREYKKIYEQNKNVYKTKNSYIDIEQTRDKKIRTCQYFNYFIYYNKKKERIRESRKSKMIQNEYNQYLLKI